MENRYVSRMIDGVRRALSFAWKWGGGARGIREEEVELFRGDRVVPASLVTPIASSAPRPGWVVLHGITRPGRHHPTLLRFVRALAGTGISVLVPEIPEWRELLLAPKEASATIRAAVLNLREREDTRPERVGVLGFSLGVPQVLLSTTDPRLEGKLRGVAGFGGYADLDRTIHFLFQGEHEWNGTLHSTDPDPYGRWVVGGNYLTHVPGLEGARDVAGALLGLAREAADPQVGAWEARCDASKDRFLRDIHPSRRGLFRGFAPPAGERPPRAFSDQIAPALARAARTAVPHSDPRSFLGRIPVPVRLVHGKGDRLIPFSESLRLAQAFPAAADVRVFLTGLFSHSHTDSGKDAGEEVEEQLHFLRILTDLFRMV